MGAKEIQEALSFPCKFPGARLRSPQPGPGCAMTDNAVMFAMFLLRDRDRDGCVAKHETGCRFHDCGDVKPNATIQWWPSHHATRAASSSSPRLWSTLNTRSSTDGKPSAVRWPATLLMYSTVRTRSRSPVESQTRGRRRPKAPGMTWPCRTAKAVKRLSRVAM